MRTVLFPSVYEKYLIPTAQYASCPLKTLFILLSEINAVEKELFGFAVIARVAVEGVSAWKFVIVAF